MLVASLVEITLVKPELENDSFRTWPVEVNLTSDKLGAGNCDTEMD